MINQSCYHIQPLTDIFDSYKIFRHIDFGIQSYQRMHMPILDGVIISSDILISQEKICARFIFSVNDTLMWATQLHINAGPPIQRGERKKPTTRGVYRGSQSLSLAIVIA